MGDPVPRLTIRSHSAERHVAQASSSVPDPAWSPHVLTDLDTDGYLLQEVP